MSAPPPPTQRRDDVMQLLEPYRRNIAFMHAVLTWRLPVISAVSAVTLQSTLWYVMVLRDGTFLALAAKLVAGIAVTDFCLTLLRVHFNIRILPFIVSACVYDDPKQELVPLETVVDGTLALKDGLLSTFQSLVALRRDHPEQFLAVSLATCVAATIGGWTMGSDVTLACATLSCLCLAPPAIARDYHVDPFARAAKLVTAAQASIRERLAAGKASGSGSGYNDGGNDGGNDDLETLLMGTGKASVVGEGETLMTARGAHDGNESGDDGDDVMEVPSGISGINTPESRRILNDEQRKDRCLLTEDKADPDVGYKWLSDQSPTVDDKGNSPADDDQFLLVNHQDVSDPDGSEGGGSM